MRSKAILTAAILGTAVLVGCEKKDDQAPATPTAPQAEGVMKDAQEAAAKTADAAAKNATDTASKANAAAADASKSASDAKADTSKAIADSGTSAAIESQATKLLDEATKYIKENKLDLAEKALTQLDGMKAQLPASFLPQLENARKALAAAKVAGGMPAMPK